MAPSSASDEPLSRDDLDCSVYVASENRDALLECVARTVGGRIGEHGVLESPALILRAAHNAYESAGQGPSGFVGWPSVLECEPPEGAAAEAYIKAVGAVLTALWAADRRAVAACAFEDRLPRSGGMHGYS